MRILISLLILSLPSAAQARFAPRYTFEELVQRSDLVLIIEHESTSETKERDEERHGTGRVTTAKVLTALRGECKDAKIFIRHFDYAKNPHSPNAVVFPGTHKPVPLSKGARTVYANSPWCYLAFLKKGSDNSYVPAVDAYDSALCFLSLMDASILAHLAEPAAKIRRDEE